MIDFIDMESAKNQREVEIRLRDALKYDRARVQLGKISRFGLMELSRQRLRPALAESAHIPCPRCHGIGHIRGTESTALHILRIIQEEAMKGNTAQLIAQVPVDVATFLLNEKRTDVLTIETRFEVNVLLVPNRHLETPNFSVQRLGHDELNQSEPLPLSFNLVEQPEQVDPAKQMQEEAKEPRQEAVVKGITPSAPAPIASEPVAKPVHEAAVRATPAPGTSWLDKVLGWFRAKPVEAPAAAPRTAGEREPRERREPREGRRDGRRDQGGQQRRDERRGDQRRDERRGEQRRDERRADTGEGGRGAQGVRSAAQGSSPGQPRRDDRRGEGKRDERREQPKQEPRPPREPREPREAREPRETRKPRSEPVVTGLTEESTGARAQGPVGGDGAAGESEARQGGRRRRGRRGRGGADRAEAMAAEAGGAIERERPAATPEVRPATGIETAIPAPAAVAAAEVMVAARQPVAAVHEPAPAIAEVRTLPPEPAAAALVDLETAPLPVAAEPVALTPPRPRNIPDLPPVQLTLPAESGLELVETRHHAEKPAAPEVEPPRPKRPRPPRVQIADEPLQIVETRSDSAEGRPPGG